MDQDEIRAFVEAWLRDHAGVIDEVIAVVGDDPKTPYGAASEAALAVMLDWNPTHA